MHISSGFAATSVDLFSILLLVRHTASLLGKLIVILGPLLEFTKLPFSLPLVCVLRVDDPAYTVLHAIFPFSPILAAI